MRPIPLNSQIPLILAFLALSPFDGLLNCIRGQVEEKCDFDSLNADEASLKHVCDEKSSKENFFIYCNGPLLKVGGCDFFDIYLVQIQFDNSFCRAWDWEKLCYWLKGILQQ
jgi:hypothetical protein